MEKKKYKIMGSIGYNYFYKLKTLTFFFLAFQLKLLLNLCFKNHEQLVFFSLSKQLLNILYILTSIHTHTHTQLLARFVLLSFRCVKSFFVWFAAEKC